MSLLENDLVIRTSLIPGAGKGLFTKHAVKKGSYIVEYKGRRTTWDDVAHDADNMYICYIHDAFVIDGRNHVDDLARYANDAAGLTRVKGLANNAHYVYDKDRVYIEATKDIAAGAEIFVSYGKGYWDTVHENMRIDEEAEERA
jgi:SET domain-containing protein